METGYYIDRRYLHDVNRQDQQRNFGQIVEHVINSKPFLVQRELAFEHPLRMVPQFRYAEFYFWADPENRKLRLLYPRLELDMSQEWNHSQKERVFNALGSLWTEEQMHHIYYYLRQQPFSEYYYALQEFKWAAHLWSFPLFEQYNRVQLIEGKLFGYLPASKSQDVEYGWFLLNEETVGRELHLRKGEDDISNRRKKNLTKHLARLHQNDPYAKREVCQKKWAVGYREGVLEYMPSMAAARFSKEKVDVLHSLSLGGLPRELRFSEVLEDTLSTLTGGNLDKLELLAELFARVFCSSIPSKYLWYIHGNSICFSQWLSFLAEDKTNATLFNSNQNKLKEYMICDQSRGVLIQWNTDWITVEQLARLNQSRLSRYIEGSEEIEIDDPYQVEQTVAYSPAVLFLSDGDTIDSTKAFKKLPVRELDIPYDWRIPTLSLSDIQWLKTCFVARGLQTVQGLTQREEQGERTSLEQIVRQFAADFCETGADYRTDCKVFYETLKDHIDTLPYQVDLAGSTTTNRLIETWMGWERRTDRTNKNRLAFEGVRLDMDKLNAALTEAQGQKEQKRRERTAQNFHTYLTQTSCLVLWPQDLP